MHATNLGDLQSVLISANRCLDCADPRCVNSCPEHIDVRQAMSVIVNRGSTRQSAWTQNENAAITSAMNAIEASFD